MRILFDQGTPVPLRHSLPGHVIEIAFDKGWGELLNGELLQAAEADGFSMLITTDKNLQYRVLCYEDAVAAPLSVKVTLYE